MTPSPASTPANGAILRLSGDWTVKTADRIEPLAEEIAAREDVRALDLGDVSRLDTAGAWLIDRARRQAAGQGREVELLNVSPDHETMLKEAHYREFEVHTPAPRNGFVHFLEDIGRSIVGFGRDFAAGVSFLGQVIATIFTTALHPSHIRFAPLFFHLESFGFRSVPIITLISFLVGAIVTQQAMFQLQKFGGAFFAVDLLGILTLRELGVLLTAIMIAGRSGSAITAEIGSMKMREEIDAMRVMGFSPMEMLIAPRIVALMIALPLLTFLADMAGIGGGFVVSVTYGQMAPEIFFERLKASIWMSTFLVGMIKAPFMALVIGIIAASEGLAVQGSAESLGRQVTSSVVKGIFMVIVVDALFALFFSAIRY
jgi:phospholipid/cholesterol/gamma-HCH transport system permease protein